VSEVEEESSEDELLEQVEIDPVDLDELEEADVLVDDPDDDDDAVGDLDDDDAVGDLEDSDIVESSLSAVAKPKKILVLGGDVDQEEALLDDDDDDDDDDDVEASLDVILKERLVVDPDEDDEDEVVVEDERGDPTLRVLPRQPGEFVCQSCFLLKSELQLADAERLLCRDCV
jgi:hypothetical protein